MKNNKLAMFLAIALTLNSCAPKSVIVPTKTAIPTSTHIPSTITPTPSLSRDTIYFWWRENNAASQLWEIKPNGDSTILYELPFSQTLDEVIDTGLLTENGVKTLQQLATSYPNSPKPKADKVSVQLYPSSLHLSPDRIRLAWQEGVSYCTRISDISYCNGETIIHIFNVETKKIEFSLTVPIEQEVFFTPTWSPDSNKLAYNTRQSNSDTEINIIHIFDITSTTTITIEGAAKFAWTRDSSNIIVSDFDGIHLHALSKQENKHILEGNWSISDLEISPDGNSLIFTGMKDSPFEHPYFQFIYVLDLKTNVAQPIINENKRDWIENLQWLPDGKQIIYTQKEPYTAPPNQIFIRNVGTGETVLIENIPLDVDNDWQVSKDGKKLLFVGWKYGETVSMIIYDINKKEWDKVPVPATIQTIMNKNLQEGEYIKRYRLWSATW